MNRLQSDFLKLNIYDAVKGFIVAFLTAVLTAVSQYLGLGAIPNIDQLKVAGIAGMAAGISYLIKNFFTHSTGELGTKKEAPVSSFYSNPKNRA